MSKLYFYYSAMNAGKSTALLQSSYNYQERRMRTLIYTYGDKLHAKIGVLKSRIGLYQNAMLYNEETKFRDVICLEHNNIKIHCVLVDESQFLTKNQVSDLSDVVDELNIPVLCYGIRTDFLGNPFIGSLYLLAWADELVELKTVCFCGKKATMVQRLDSKGLPTCSGEQKFIGGNESYVSFCRKHYKIASKKKLHKIQPASKKYQLCFKN